VNNVYRASKGKIEIPALVREALTNRSMAVSAVCMMFLAILAKPR